MQTTDALMFITNRPDVEFVRGEGSYLFDTSGRRYLDFVQGWAVNVLGHSPSVILNALAEQSVRVINVSPAYYNEPMRRLANLLARLSGLDRVLFGSSGAEANEGAVKLARKWGAVKREGAYEVIAFERGFHGRTLTMMSASGKPHWKNLYEPKTPGFIHAPVDDFAAIQRAISPKTAAVMLEPIQGEAGVFPFSTSFLRDLRALTEEQGILLIFDEVQTGIGRTGKMFCYEHAGILPDVVTLAKGIGGGVPLSAVLAREEVCLFEPGDQGGTFIGNALMMAVGCAVVEEVSRTEFLANVAVTGEYLSGRLEHLSAEMNLGGVRGMGLLLALELGSAIGPQVVESALRLGLLLNSPRPTTLRFMPALNVSRIEIDEMISILQLAIERAIVS